MLGYPESVTPGPATASSWRLIDAAVAAIPSGRWTSYGELGALAGVIPLAVGRHMRDSSAPHAWRVLRADGRVADRFASSPGSPHAGTDPYDLLEAEGIAFDVRGRADPSARLSARELAALVRLRPDPGSAGGPGEATA